MPFWNYFMSIIVDNGKGNIDENCKSSNSFFGTAMKSEGGIKKNIVWDWYAFYRP